MDYNDIVHERRSIRGYQQKPVPRELIEEIIDLAKRAPSSMNTQPWHFHVITGEPLERIRKGNTEKMMSGSAVDREIKMNKVEERRSIAFALLDKKKRDKVTPD